MNRFAPSRFALLDRDGTILVKVPYLNDPGQAALIPGAGEALRILRSLGFGLLVLTNQSAIGRGLLTSSGLEQIHVRMKALLSEQGVVLDGIYTCPHLPEDGCTCRKPQPGLVEQAARDWGFEHQSCLVIGDNKCDVDLGRRIGAETILVRTGEGGQLEKEGISGADWIEDNILAAARSLAKRAYHLAEERA